MADRKLDPEIGALQAVHAALKPLSAEERTRVLASVYALLGMAAPETISPAAKPSSSPASSTPSVAPRPQARPLSINELVQEKPPGTNAQRIALFAYYRDKHERVARFARDDLKGYFAKAKEQPPTNYDRDFVEAVRKGWIHEDGAESYITSKGIETVESGFAGERRYAKRPRKPRKAAPRKAKRGRKANGAGK